MTNEEYEVFQADRAWADAIAQASSSANAKPDIWARVQSTLGAPPITLFQASVLNSTQKAVATTLVTALTAAISELTRLEGESPRHAEWRKGVAPLLAKIDAGPSTDTTEALRLRIVAAQQRKDLAPGAKALLAAMKTEPPVFTPGYDPAAFDAALAAVALFFS